MGIALAVLDMAGTTVEDEGLVLACFVHAAKETGLVASEDDVNARMGMGKLAVFHELATRQLGPGERAERLRDETYGAFRACLEARYERGEAKLMPGALETFAWLRDRSVRVALNTGFYRRVTELLVERLDFGRWVDTVVCSDDVPEGRPGRPFRSRAATRATDARRRLGRGCTRAHRSRRTTAPVIVTR
jgi:phosphonatase-like hydrolase